VVYLIGLDAVDQVAKLLLAGEVTMVEKEAALRFMRVLEDVIYPTGIKGRSTSNNSMDLITLG
jgi:hypothetical protein